MLKIFILFFIFIAGCLHTHKEILDEGGDIAYKEKPVTNQPAVNNSSTLVNERLDSLERNAVNKQDVDASIESLRNMVNQLKAQVAYLEMKQKPKEQTSDKKESEKKDPYRQAESYFQDKKWKQAIFAYEQFRKEQPQSLQFPTATLRIGLSFIELGLNKEAQVFLKEVVERFPKSKEAETAKKLLENKSSS